MIEYVVPFDFTERPREERAKRYLPMRTETAIWQHEQQLTERLIESLPNGLSVLDAPSGPGRFLETYRRKNMSVTGLDISPYMHDLVRQQYGPLADECKMTVGSADILPFADRSFDVVVSTRFLSHIVPFNRARDCLAEFHRVTRRWALIMLKNRVLPAELPPLPTQQLQWGLSLGQLTTMLSEIGFAVEATELTPPESEPNFERRMYVLTRR